MLNVQWGVTIACAVLTMYNILMLITLRQRAIELKNFEDTLRDLLMRIRARALKRK